MGPRKDLEKCSRNWKIECGPSTCGRCGRLKRGQVVEGSCASQTGGFYYEGQRSQECGGSIRCGCEGRNCCGGLTGGRLSREAVPVFQGSIARAWMRTAENRGLIQEAFRSCVSAEGRKQRRLTAPFTKVLKINQGRTKNYFSSEAGGGGRKGESLVWNILNLRCPKVMFIRVINVAVALGSKAGKEGLVGGLLA